MSHSGGLDLGDLIMTIVLNVGNRIFLSMVGMIERVLGERIQNEQYLVWQV